MIAIIRYLVNLVLTMFLAVFYCELYMNTDGAVGNGPYRNT